MTTERIQQALQTIAYPGFSRDIVSFGLIQSVGFEDGVARIQFTITTGDESIPQQIADRIKTTVGALDGIASVEVEAQVTTPGAKPTGGEPATNAAMQRVKHVIAVASGKGGVGKSTFSVNIACAMERLLAAEGKPAQVGIMDCDIYGPSIPLMLGASGRPEIRNEMIVPLENFGVRTISMGFLIDEDTPVVWRGPMIMKTIQQFAQNVDWGELEVLIVDLPPGTGDAQLSLVQTLPLDGAVIVTTPQPAASNVARRGARMFGKVNVPILGVAENMSYLEGPNGERQTLFGEGGGQQTATDLEAPFLGQVPLDPAIRTGCDNGIPIVISEADCPASQVFSKIAGQLLDVLRR